MAIDKETNIPLKVENFSAAGELELSYEVTKLEYDLAIADSAFTQIPSGAEKLPAEKLPELPGQWSPGIRVPAPATPHTTR